MLPADVAERAAAYGMPGVIVDGMDAEAVRAAAEQAVERARTGGGPTLLEAKTYRYYDHQGVKGLRIPYRTQEEVDAWKARDPITLIEERALACGAASREDLEAVWERTRAEIAEAVAFAEQSPDPDPGALLADVYTSGPQGTEERA